MNVTPGKPDLARKGRAEPASTPSEWAALLLRSRQSPSLAPRESDPDRPDIAEAAAPSRADAKAAQVRSPRRIHKPTRRS